jgi:hypothetical protein
MLAIITEGFMSGYPRHQLSEITSTHIMIATLSVIG